MPDWILALAAGFALDLLLGDPEWFPHPVRAIGRYASLCEQWGRWLSMHPSRRNHARRFLRRWAVLLTASTVLLTMAATFAALWLLGMWGRWPLLTGMALLNWMGLSTKCLAREARLVREALGDGVEAGRRQVSRIVGRDTRSLTAGEVICATVETVAENTTDGVFSPMLYSLLGGPVLLMGFKAASTLDSMVGYLDPKYLDIGWSSARLDDVLNWVPARLTAAWMCLSAGLLGWDGWAAWKIVRRDRKNHKSPNCAWSEAAAAGALGIRLGGAHSYFGRVVEKPTIGDDLRPPETDDIARAVRLMYLSASLFLLCVLGVGRLLGWALGL